jgi:hypothetical protein
MEFRIPVKARLLSREVLPLLLALLGLLAATLLVDALLHVAGWLAVGKYLGIPGVLLIIGSFAYSLRKRKLIRSGSPVRMLRWHEGLAWTGSLLVLVHAGVHFNALLAWLALLAMILNIASGLTGKYLIDGARRRLAESRRQMQQAGIADEAADERLYWDSLTYDALRQWRVVHLPIALAFGVLGLAHIVSSMLFWNVP